MGDGQWVVLSNYAIVKRGAEWGEGEPTGQRCVRNKVPPVTAIIRDPKKLGQSQRTLVAGGKQAGTRR